MNDQKITKEGLETIQTMYANAVGLWRETNSAFSRQQEQYLTGHLKYTETVMQTIGVIAGFGFTAISAVHEIWLFIVGELLLLGSVCYGMLRTRKTYVDTIDVLKREGDKNSEAHHKRVDYLASLVLQGTTKSSVPKDFQEQVKANDKAIVKLTTPKKSNEDDHFQDYIAGTVGIAAVGIILVLLSFIDIQWLSTICIIYRALYR